MEVDYYAHGTKLADMIALDNAITDAQLMKDRYIYGNSFHTVDVAGRKTRIDPTTVTPIYKTVTKDTVGYEVIGDSGKIEFVYSLTEIVVQ